MSPLKQLIKSENTAIKAQGIARRWEKYSIYHHKLTPENGSHSLDLLVQWMIMVHLLAAGDDGIEACFSTGQIRLRSRRRWMGNGIKTSDQALCVWLRINDDMKLLVFLFRYMVFSQIVIYFKSKLKRRQRLFLICWLINIFFSGGGPLQLFLYIVMLFFFFSWFAYLFTIPLKIRWVEHM